jgi:hypothetical protein
MSVRPVTFLPNGDIEVVFDELGHSGTIPAAEVQWAKNIDGTDNHHGIVLACPDGCGAVSTHPVGGGAAPEHVQQMFVDKVTRDGCPCGSVPARRRDATPAAHVRLQCNRTDGMGRWQQDDAETKLLAAPTAAEASPLLEVIYDPTSRAIVGMLPSGGVTDPYAVASLDVSEYDNLMRYVPSYLSADGDHIVGVPE